MRIVSFNVNSIRQRLPHLRALVESHAPEVIGLQETKVTDDDFPLEAVESLGYHVAFQGQKTHYGVALLTRTEPLRIINGFPTDADDAQRRWIGAEIETAQGRRLTVYNGYFPQGESRDHPVKFPAKAKFYTDVLTQLNADHQPDDAVVVMGDLNIAAEDRDIGIGPDNVKRWLKTGKASFLPEERTWLQSLFDWGLVDTYRRCHPTTDDCFSWFDYRSKGFEREPRRGLRIDYILASAALADSVVASGSDYLIRSMDKPSDHCPVWSEFDV